jgi:methionyl-tRNA formyltransferase
MPLRIVFFGNSESTFTSRHFQPLVDAGHELVAVVDVPAERRHSTNPLPPGLPNFVHVARERNIPALEPTAARDPSFAHSLRALSPDLFVAVGYALILPRDLLALPRLLVANFHASLLPAYRGKHPVFWTLRSGERWGGLTVHAMDRGIDTGDILYQVRVRTRRDDTVAALYDRIMDRSVPLVGRLLRDAEGGNILRRPQPSGEDSYFSSTTNEDFRIHWDWPAERIRRYITMTPGKCYADLSGGRVFFLDAERQSPSQVTSPGCILAIGRSRCTVAAGQGAVSLRRVSTSDVREQSMAALCRRRGLAAGDSLQ